MTDANNPLMMCRLLLWFITGESEGFRTSRGLAPDAGPARADETIFAVSPAAAMVASPPPKAVGSPADASPALDRSARIVYD
jgi:hypothetical protein